AQRKFNKWHIQKLNKQNPIRLRRYQCPLILFKIRQDPKVPSPKILCQTPFHQKFQNPLMHLRSRRMIASAPKAVLADKRQA
ncbi:MAG: hypothetical protein V7661_16510, partial [Sulfitobacter sp.]